MRSPRVSRGDSHRAQLTWVLPGLWQGDAVRVGSIDDKRDFQEVVGGMKSLGYNQETQDRVFELVAAIILLGEVRAR